MKEVAEAINDTMFKTLDIMGLMSMPRKSSAVKNLLLGSLNFGIGTV
jgi:hypothetical protein